MGMPATESRVVNGYCQSGNFRKIRADRAMSKTRTRSVPHYPNGWDPGAHRISTFAALSAFGTRHEISRSGAQSGRLRSPAEADRDPIRARARSRPRFLAVIYLIVHGLIIRERGELTWRNDINMEFWCRNMNLRGISRAVCLRQSVRVSLSVRSRESVRENER
jgi:hypothetical protein